MGTFHSIGAKILRRHAELVGLRANFTILDTDDQIRLIKQLLQSENIDDKRWPARALASQIDAWKNRGLDPAHAPAGEAASFANGRGAALYAAYQSRLKILNAADFGDLLLEGLRLFREQPEILQLYQKRLRYILVDEYQDTNAVQYLWLKLLAQASGNLCCVGDDDQSIYSWRGADVDNILRFEQDFPGAKVIRLERNYRSTGNILAAASHLIAHNQGRLGKTLFTSAEPGDKPTVAGLWDSQEEARVVGEEIEALQHRGQSLDEIAILVRASFQMREFEERFVTIGLPYKVIGGPRFYERQEIRDALAYLRCVFQPDDDLAFERIFNVPRRGLGEATLNHAALRYLPQFITSGIVDDVTRPRFEKAVHEFRRIRRSTIPWLVVITIALVWMFVDRPVTHTDEMSWAIDEKGGLGFGGTWFSYVVRPIFEILLLGWLWRIALLSFQFMRFSRIGLQLVPSHPDRAGGLGFLERLPQAFAPVSLGLSAMLASRWAHQIVHHNMPLDALKVPAAVFIIVWSLVLFLPLAALMPVLHAAKRAALPSYAAMVAEQGRLVRQRWIDRTTNAEPPLLEPAGIGPIADAATMYGQVKAMKILPIGKTSLIAVLLPIVVPMVIVAAIRIPIGKMLLGLVHALM